MYLLLILYFSLSIYHIPALLSISRKNTEGKRRRMNKCDAGLGACGFHRRRNKHGSMIAERCKNKIKKTMLYNVVCNYIM